MRVCASVSRWLAVSALACTCGAAFAAFSATSVRADIVERELHVNALLDLGLTPAVEEAVNKGIPLEVTFEINLNRHRRFWRDREIDTWSFVRRVHFFALSGQYVVSGPADEREAFVSLNDALRYMGALQGMVLSLREDPGEGDFRLNIRAQVDVESLPAPLRPVAYASPAWRLNTGWTTWKVQP